MFSSKGRGETRFVIPNSGGVGSYGTPRATSFICEGPNEFWAVSVQAEAISTPLRYKFGN